MSVSRFFVPAAGLIAGLAFATASNAAVIVSNLAANLDTGTPTSSSLYDNNSKGMFFTPNGGYKVGTLTLKLRDQSTTPNTLGVVEAKLYATAAGGTDLSGPALVTFTADSPTTPIAAGTQLATTPPTSNTGTNYTFSPNTTFNLVAGTAYVVVIDGMPTAANGNTNPNTNTATSTHVFQWLATKTTTGTGDATIGTPRSGTRTSVPNTSTNYNVFQLEGTAVPEPATASLTLIAASAGLLRRRR